ncbi:hypothetical protein XELAEV_18017660mg [Xenopus laevis]|uniref:Uncharacterized protein n=1 Tax=Xenopus laevis TaxID=8355 RepID=A0A974DDS4_XENLA|nr:hypothetical protein XELAEV_18017660mg [Xenopus laevis]
MYYTIEYVLQYTRVCSALYHGVSGVLHHRVEPLWYFCNGCHSYLCHFGTIVCTEDFEGVGYLQLLFLSLRKVTLCDRNVRFSIKPFLFCC